MVVIAVDFGGTIIKTGLIKDGRILAIDKINAQSVIGLKPSLPAIEKIIFSYMNQVGNDHEDLAGIGISFPGLVDSQKMKVLSTNKKYQDAEKIDFQDWSKGNFGLSVLMENDARMALMGEWQFGAGKGVDNIVMMTLGTGVGSATMINGKLLRGRHFQAGCLGGHFTVQINGNECTCGNIGCVEAEASTWRVEEMIKSHPLYQSSSMSKGKADFESLFQCADEGDELSISLRDHCLEVWSAGIINLIHAYDPELIIMSGGVMKSADFILPFIRKKVERFAWTPWGKVNLVASKVPDESSLLGVYALLSNPELQ
jgi:glucokinase